MIRNPFKKQPILEFYCHPDLENILPKPVAAFKHIPEWWKKLSPTYDARDSFGAPAMTAKKCMPLLDVMSLGYIIPLQGDLYVQTNIDKTIINITNPPGLKVAEFHDSKQVGGFGGANPVKFINRWVIKTAPGWSSLFIPPPNAFNPHFTCLAGLVDTDKYAKEVNFPAIWNTPNFDDKIPAGTPLVTVIPIKRNMIERHPIIRSMTKDEFKNIDNITKIQESRSSHYTNELREPRK